MQKPLDPQQLATLRRLAEQLSPWENPDELAADLSGLCIRVLNDASFEDVRAFEKIVGTDYLKRVLQESPAILFTSRALSYWTLRLGLPPRSIPERCKGIRPILDKKYGGWYS